MILFVHIPSSHTSSRKASIIMTSNAAFRLLCLFLFSSPLLKCVVAQEDVEFDLTPMMRGFDDMGEMQGHRRMSAWGSWTNLFFAIGICNADGCECGVPHGPLCGCPHCNCNNTHVPPHCHKICYVGCDSTSSGENGDSAGNGVDSDYENVADTEKNGQGDVGQQGSSRRNWMYALVAAAVATAGVGAFVIRKRRQTATAKSLGEQGMTEEENDYALMGGMTAAFGGIMSRMGLNSGDSTSGGSSTASEETGVVSKRMNLLKNGDDVVPLDGGAAPQFIEIPKGNREPEPLPVDEGIEVEGPYRPSSQYAI